jgi:Holliday junction resolvasome RuvABC DNA-binding subunit
LLRDDIERPDGLAAPDLRADAVEALVQLQYGRRDAESVVEAVMLAQPEIETIEALLRLVLEGQAPPS